jgi:sugar/nucleoside kinase (ribokinase family)
VNPTSTIDGSSFRGRRLCVVGNLNRDLRTAPIATGRHLFEDGETSTEFVRETPGGGGTNSALFVARLGARVRLVAKVGADQAGAQLARDVRRLGVRPFLAVDDTHPTGTSINLVYSTGRRHFVSALQSCAIAYDEIDPAALRGCGHVLRADVWFSEAMLFGGNEKLLAAARAQGADTSLDINWDPAWNAAPRVRVAARKRAVRNVLPLVDLAHGNVRELCEFADAKNLDEALKRLTRWGAKAVVVHMGTRGAGYYHEGRLVRCPCVPAERVVNSTGTGDLLSVCMILLHRHPAPAAEKLKVANRIVSMYVRGGVPCDAPVTAGGPS